MNQSIENTQDLQDTPETITKTECSEKDRLAFLPSLLGNAFHAFEKRLYYFANQLVEGYKGGYWDFYKLSNGGFFCQCDSDYREPFTFNSPNGISHVVTDEVAGIVLCLITLSDLSFVCEERFPDDMEKVVNAFHALRDFVGEHEHRAIIYQLID